MSSYVPHSMTHCPDKVAVNMGPEQSLVGKETGTFQEDFI